ncbi:permease prefix domain 1-containing protein [Promicromonospora sukumoe]
MTTSVHRLLDEAFAGLPATHDVQDLKEEIRANLLDRVAELTAGGVAPDDAARRAVGELGDVRELVEEADAGSGVPVAPGPGVASAAAAASERRRVPPQRRYVAGIVVASVAIVLAFVPFAWVMVLVADNPYLEWYVPLALAAPLLVGPAVGWIVGASLARETVASYGMPRRRAVAFGFATALILTGLVVGVEGYVLFASPGWGFRLGLPLLVAGGAWLAYLLATQTNRHKPWVLEQARVHAEAANRFEEDPAAAARFGIYTAAVWVVAFVVFLVLGLAVGWAWSWLALVGGFVVMMLMLATMLFGVGREGQARKAD